MVILENVGDNTYQEVARPQFGVGWYPRNLDSGDFNGDGWGDILVSDSGSNVYVIACRGDNVYELAWQRHLYLNTGAGDVAGLGDADGDGRLEFMVTEETLPRFWIFESVGGDEYFQVFTAATPTSSFLLSPGDVDGDGRNEVVMSTGIRLHIWKSIANDTWERIWEAPASGRSDTFTLTADLNNNGFAEIFYTCCWPANNRSYLVEWPFRVDVSQNDADRPGDLLFTTRSRAQLRDVWIRLNSLDVTGRIRNQWQSGNPRVSLTEQGDESVLRLNLAGLGLPSGRQVRFTILARDRQTDEVYQDQVTYVAP